MNERPRNRWWVLLLVGLVSAAPRAADPQKDAPEAVALRIAKLTAARDFEGLASLMDPEGSVSLREVVAESIELEPKEHLAEALAYLGVATLEELRTIAPREFMVLLLRSLSKKEPDEALRSAKFEVVGSVSEGDTTRHVIVRTKMTIGGTQVPHVDVVTLRQADGAWRMLFSNHMHRYLAELRQSNKAKRSRPATRQASAGGKAASPQHPAIWQT